MTWIFSKAMMEDYASSLCSPAPAAASLAATCSDGEPFAQLSVMPTPHKFWRNDKTIECSDLSRFGLTSQLLTDDHGAAVLTSFLAAFPARTSVSPALALGSTASEAVCGLTWRASFAKFNHATFSWKTAQYSLLADSDEFLETWPRWGSMLNGGSFLRPTPALHICESAYGSWPTPTASLGSKGGRITPRKGREGGTLIEAVSARLYATPTARDWRSGKASQETMERNSRPLSEQIGGLLNPEWVEWLMGWPIGWTALEPLETAKFHEWRQQHSIYCADSGSIAVPQQPKP